MKHNAVKSQSLDITKTDFLASADFWCFCILLTSTLAFDEIQYFMHQFIISSEGEKRMYPVFGRAVYVQ